MANDYPNEGNLTQLETMKEGTETSEVVFIGVQSVTGFIHCGGQLGASMFIAGGTSMIMRLLPFVGNMNNTFFEDFMMKQPKFFDVNFLRPD
jgi:hypothetical protein